MTAKKHNPIVTGSIALISAISKVADAEQELQCLDNELAKELTELEWTEGDGFEELMKFINHINHTRYYLANICRHTADANILNAIPADKHAAVSEIIKKIRAAGSEQDPSLSPLPPVQSPTHKEIAA